MTLSWADSGNRTRIFSLAKRNFTIRPYPHFFVRDTQYIHTYMIIYTWIIFVQCRARDSLQSDSNYFLNLILNLINCIFFIQEVCKKFDPPLIFFSFYFGDLILNCNVSHNRENFFLGGGVVSVLDLGRIGSRDERIKDTHQKD